MTTAASFESLATLIKQRRSNLRIDPERPVAPELVGQLCELAVWAPNHKRTDPWRFVVLTGEGRSRLGEALAETLIARGDQDEERLAKARSKYLRAPVMLLVGAAAHEDPVLHAENRDAAAAGVQNLLLGATALGLASYWSTGDAALAPAVKKLCGLEETDQVVAIIYVGWPTSALPAPPKVAPSITTIAD